MTYYSGLSELFMGVAAPPLFVGIVIPFMRVLFIIFVVALVGYGLYRLLR